MNVRRENIGFGIAIVVYLGLVTLTGCYESFGYLGNDCPADMSDACCTCLLTPEHCEPEIVTFCTNEQRDGGAGGGPCE